MTLQQWLETNDDTDKAGEHISEQWTGIDEAGDSVDINTITSGSGRKMLWKCSQGHQWYATVNLRTSSKTGCKYCYANQRKLGQHVKAVNEDESLYIWCLNNEYGQTILKEWTGKTVDNNIIDIKNTNVQSNKNVYWICSKNKEHIWHTKIQKRALLYSGCPYCCGQKTSEANSLLQYCIENKLQYLIDEFTGFDENNNKIDMTQVSKASHKKVKWKHKINGIEHEWIASISDRVYKHSMCPYCNSKNKNIHGKNDLLTWCKNNGDFGDKIIKSWVGLDEHYNKIDISSISYGSKKRVLLQCECGNIFCKEILKLTYNKHILCKKCLYESRENKRYSTMLNSSKTLKEWCNNNSIYGIRIKNEFAGVDFEGNSVSIDDITYGSTRNVLWSHYTKSGELHEWYATIHNRVCNKSMCPICNNKGTSLPEQIIYRSIKQVYSDTISRGKFQGYEFDISIPELKTCIEYGSTYYHDDRKERDIEKQELCKKYNVNFIQIIDDSSNKIDETWSSNLIITKIALNKIECIEKIVKYLCKTLNIDYKCIDFKKAVIDSIEFMSN